MKHIKAYKIYEDTVDFYDIDKNSPPSTDDSVGFVSRHAVGERVYFSYCGNKIPALVRIVTHTTGKVRYALLLIGKEDGSTEPLYTTIHNVDSVFVEDYPNEDGTKHIEKLDFDNYS